MQLSIVTTLYQSGSFVSEFHEKISSVVAELLVEYEIIFVNDGSPDNSLDIALDIAATDSSVTVVDLARNFGHHKAILAGLSQACGERIFLLDIDLEEEPGWLLKFWEEMQSSDVDVVYGVQPVRQGGIVKKVTGRLFYQVFNLCSEVSIPSNLCTVRLMTREYVQALTELKDENLFLAGNAAWIGFKQKAIVVDKKSRKSTSTYSALAMLKLSWNAITSFSSYPLQLVFMLGLLISSFSGIFGLYIIITRLLMPGAVQVGFASIIVSIWFLSGLIILFVGLIGLYLAKIFTEVKGRPQYIVRRIYRSEKNDRS